MLVPPAPLRAVQERLCERAVEIIEGDPKDVLYQHTTLCQVYFPYRDPKTVRRWTRTKGRVSTPSARPPETGALNVSTPTRAPPGAAREGRGIDSTGRSLVTPDPPHRPIE